MRKRSTVNNQQSTVNVSLFGIKLLKHTFLLLSFFFLISGISAQSVSASLDRDKILLGEQVTFQLNLTNLNPSTSFIASWPQLKDTINHIEILKRTGIDTIAVNGSNSYQQNFTVTGFDSGRWQLGPFYFMIQDKASGKKIKISSPVLFLTVLPVDVSALKDYHPLKDIIEVQPSFNWLPLIIAAAILLIIIIVFIIIKKRKKKITATPKPILPGTPLERAIKKLDQLKNNSLNNDPETKIFHSDVDIICRQYFEEITHINAMQITASELFSRMNVYMQDAKLRESVRAIFELNASVKFAKYMPSENESKSILNDVILSLQQIDALAQQARSNADRMV